MLGLRRGESLAVGLVVVLLLATAVAALVVRPSAGAGYASYRGALPGGPHEVSVRTVDAAFVAADNTLALTTHGSSSCPALPMDVERIATDVVRVRVESDDGTCTADLSPRTTLLRVQPDLPSGAVVRVVGDVERTVEVRTLSRLSPARG